MDILKKVFPFAFNAKKGDVASLVIANPHEETMRIVNLSAERLKK